MLKRIFTVLPFFLVLVSLSFSAFSVDVNAKAAILIDASSKEILYAVNEDVRLPMASTTKIMTALVVLENCSIDEKVEITADMVGVEGSSIYLRENEVLTVKDLLYGLMLASANDAAEALAIHIGGSVCDFADMMNNKAEELQLYNTRFNNPHGLDSNDHYTSARDLAILTSYCLENKGFSEIVSTISYTIPETEYSPARTIKNHNKLLGIYDGCIGVKTGFTKKCGRCLVSAAERDGVRLIAVTLSCGGDWNAHNQMLDYGFSLYERRTLANEGELKFELPVFFGEKSLVSIANRDEVTVNLKKSDKEVKCRIILIKTRYLAAPICIGDHIADAVFTCGTEEIVRVPLYAQEDVLPKE